jgi:hypothetical protein
MAPLWSIMYTVMFAPWLCCGFLETSGEYKGIFQAVCSFKRVFGDVGYKRAY